MTELLVDLVCMIYHEARNVRHPVKANRVSEAELPKYRMLISDLPKNREEAWQKMHSLRAQAENASVPSAVFEEKYGLSVTQLAELFECPIWEHSAYGGNRWGAIARKVAECLELHTLGEVYKRDQLIGEILDMHHHTGKVSDKLKKLKHSSP